MGRVRTFSRRAFLVGSASIAGGVAFGVFKVNTPYPNPLAENLADGEVTFNPWVLIDGNKVTLITPHADKGQGVMSMQAALIAEELDIEFGQFETSFGDPSPAYWNTAMADEAAPFMATDQGRTAEAARTVIASLVKLLGMQGTGGSTAVPDSYVKLRQAGAMARETLKRAASEMTGVSVGQLTTSGGAVHLPDGRTLNYTELAQAASGADPVLRVDLRAPSEWRMIGKPMQRLDILAKSMGTQAYGIDARVEGMVHATVKTNPRQGGMLNGYDAEAAKAMPGVLKIVPISNGVAVVASNTWYAFQAAEAIGFDWGPAPYPAGQDQHWETLSASFSDKHLDSNWRDDGDVEAALGRGEAISAEYRSPYVAHAPMEPLNAIVRVTDAMVEVWTGHQMPTVLQRAVAGVTGHKPSQVRFHNAFIGGSFGHRLEAEYLVQAAQVAVQMKGVPVKMTYSREEDFAHDFPRHISIGRATGTVAGGRVEAIDLQIAAPSVVQSQMGRAGLSPPGPDPQIAAGSWNNPYAVPNFRMRAYRAPPLAPVSSWRSVGAPGAGFFFDSFLDELIHAAGADPMAERIRLMRHDVSRKVLEAVAEMSSWGGELAPNQGRGVAFVESFGVPTAEVVEVTDTEHGIRIDRVWVACDVGQIVDPVNFENLVQGGAVFGLGHAMNCEITYSDGMAEQVNYFDAEAMRMPQCPEIFVKGLENGPKIRGIGEPPVPPAAPALANAIFAATGQRIREMPFSRHVGFV